MGMNAGGEDGAVKMWSRNGMLRSVLAQLGKPVYAVDWNGDSTKLVYCAGEECHIKQLKAQVRGRGQKWGWMIDCQRRMGKICEHPELDSPPPPLTQIPPTKWRAHAGLVLCLSWSAVTDQIASGGEDCRYKVWDGQGRPLWSSGPQGHPVCSLAWNPSGEMFAVGAYNLLRLCDKSGVGIETER